MLRTTHTEYLTGELARVRGAAKRGATETPRVPVPAIRPGDYG